MSRRSSFIATFVSLLICASSIPPGWAQCALPYTFVDGQVIDATQLMANFNSLASCLNPGGSTNALQYNSGTGSLSGVGPLTDGQLAIGSGAGAPQAQTLGAGTGIAITNAPGSVTVARTASGTATGLFRQIMSATPTAASTGLATWLNQGASTVTDSAVGISISSPTNAATSVSGRYVSAPAAPYTITALVSATRNTTGVNMVGIGWYDGSAKLQVIYNQSFATVYPIMRVQRFTNPTTAGGIDFTSSSSAFSVPVWFQIKDDGTNVSFAFSHDGVNFLSVYSVAKASGFLGATGYSNLIFFLNPGPTNPSIGTLLSWTQT